MSQNIHNRILYMRGKKMKQVILKLLKELPTDATLYRKYLYLLSVAIDLPLNRNNTTIKDAIIAQYQPELTPTQQATKWYDNNGVVRAMLELDVEYYLERNNLKFQDVFTEFNIW